MHFVYLIKTSDENDWYVGVTNNVARRLSEHNSGLSQHTQKFGKWLLESYIAFADRSKAEKFEKYLKSHSGRAFSKKHF